MALLHILSLCFQQLYRKLQPRIIIHLRPQYGLNHFHLKYERLNDLEHSSCSLSYLYLCQLLRRCERRQGSRREDQHRIVHHSPGLECCSFFTDFQSHRER